MVMAYQEVTAPDGGVDRHYLTGGPNPPAGVQIEYYLKQPAGETALEIVDAKGQRIQKYSSASKGAAVLPAAPGMNRFLWDMRYPGAREAPAPVQLAGFEASRPVPPVAPPGRYLARLTAGGQIYERPFEIRRDSRTTVTDADLQAQFDLLVKIRDKTSEASDVLIKVREAQQKCGGLDKAADTPDRKGKVAAVKAKLFAIETALTRITLTHPLDVTTKGLINKLGTLAGTIATGDTRPTRQQYELFDDLSARIAVQMQAFEQVLANDIPALTGSAAGAGIR